MPRSRLPVFAIGLALFGLLLSVLPIAPATASHAGSVELIPTFPLAGQQPGTGPGGTSIDPACSNGTRASSDRPDIYDGRMVHLIYLVPSDGRDEQLDTNGTLECSIRGQNHWLRQQIGREWRFDTYFDASGREMIDITFVRSARPAAELGGGTGVRADLRLAGFAVDGKRYLSYVAAGAPGGPCGDAFYPLTQDPSDPADGQYAQVYLNSSSGCGARAFGTADSPSWSEAIAQQELMHNDSMVPIGAPHTCANAAVPPLGHVCTGPLWATGLDPEKVDVMFPYVSGPLSGKIVDLGRDDYYDHGLPLLELTDSPYLRVPGSETPKSTAPTQPQPQPSPSSSPEPSPQPTPSRSPEPSPEPSGEPSPEPSGEPSPEPSPEPVASESRAERTLSLTADRTRLSQGRRTKLAATISSVPRCTRGQNVELQAKRAGTDRPFRTLKQATTNYEGRIEFRVRPRSSKTYRARVVRTDGCASDRSNRVFVRVY